MTQPRRLPAPGQKVWAAWSTESGEVVCSSYGLGGRVAMRALAIQVVHMISVARRECDMAPDDAMDTVWAALRMEVQEHIRDGRLGTFNPWHTYE